MKTLVKSLIVSVLAIGCTAFASAGNGEHSVYYKRAGKYLRKGEYDKAGPLLEKARAEYPDSIAVWAASAFYAEKQKDKESKTRFCLRLLYASTKSANHDDDDQRRINTAEEYLREIDPEACTLIEMLRIGKHSDASIQIAPILYDIDLRLQTKLAEGKEDEDVDPGAGVKLDVLCIVHRSGIIRINGESAIERLGNKGVRTAEINVKPGDIITLQMKSHGHANYFWLQAKLPSGKTAFSTASGWYEYTPEEINAWWVLDKKNPEKYDLTKLDPTTANDIMVDGLREHLRNAYESHGLKASQLNFLRGSRSITGQTYFIYVVKKSDLK